MSSSPKKESLVQVVSVENARFFAYHGYYEEEQQIGNEYFVDVSVHFRPTQTQIKAIRHEKTLNIDLEQNTINYELLYRIVNNAMQIPRKLLEKVALDILEQIKEINPMIEKAEVKIRKVHPPFGGDASIASVQFIL